MATSIDKSKDISHALVWIIENNELEMVNVEELNNFIVPENKNHVIRDKFLEISNSKYSSDKAILLALGNEDEIRIAHMDTQSSTITHAIVNFLDREEIAVIPVENIEDFLDNRPKHQLQYLEYTIYNTKKEDEYVYEKTYIYALGDYDQVSAKLNMFKNNIDHALVRFLSNNSLQVVLNDNIEDLDPSNRSDFNQLKIYSGRRTADEEYEDIQILRLGSFPECSSFIDLYNEITHSLVIFKPKNNKEVIPINFIQEFRRNPPEVANEFDKNKLYSGRLAYGNKYSAIQIFALGHEKIMIFNKINETKRLKLTKFNNSDLRECDKSVSDYNSEKTDSLNSEHNSFEISNDECTPPQEGNIKKKTKKTTISQKKDADYEQRKRILLNSGTNNMLQDNYFDANVNNNAEPSHARRPFQPINARNALKNKRTRYEANYPSSGEENNRQVCSFKQTQRYRKRYRKLGRSLPTSKPTNTLYGRISDENRYQHFFQDSDSDDGTTEERLVFERFKVHNENSTEPIEYIHLGWNTSILYSDWKSIKRDSTDEYSFISRLSDAMFGKKILQLFLQIKPFMKVADNKPRRQVTETEMNVIKHCLKYWIRAKCSQLLEERSMEAILSTARLILSNKIAAEFKKYKEKNPKNVSYMEAKTFIRN